MLPSVSLRTVWTDVGSDSRKRPGSNEPMLRRRLHVTDKSLHKISPGKHAFYISNLTFEANTATGFDEPPHRFVLMSKRAAKQISS